MNKTKTGKKKKQNIQGLWDNIHIRRKPGKEEEIFEIIMSENFSQINARHQTTDPGISENTKQDKCQRKLHLEISFPNCRKSKKKILKRARGKKYLTYEQR